MLGFMGGYFDRSQHLSKDRKNLKPIARTLFLIHAALLHYKSANDEIQT